jgi:hypothetical protein
VPGYNEGISGHGAIEMFQLLYGTTSLITAVFPIKHSSEMSGTNLEVIHKLDAPVSTEKVV